MKLRLDYFLSLGLKLVECDSLGHASNCNFNIRYDTVEKFNTIERANEQYFITSFAPRKNTGEQPCGGNVPVVVEFSERECEDDSMGDASGCEWDLRMGCIKSWKPYIDALIKMQIEHDKNIVKREDEPEQKPVEWVYEEFGQSFKMGDCVIYNGKEGVLVGIHNAAPLVSFKGVYSRVSGYGLSKPETAEQKEAKQQIAVIDNVIRVQSKSINELTDSNAELLAEKQKLERLI